jgi:spore coat polysaccharide biosynthesis protein SpsF
MKNIAIIQARLGSTRLPYKTMLSLHGKPIIEWVIHRVKKSKLLDEIIVAIPESEENNILAKYVEELNVQVFRGNENNVLKRFYEAVKNKNAANIIRICADNPLIDGGEIDNLIDFYNKNNCDYAYNHIPLNNKYPDGLGAEIVSYKLLSKLYSVVETRQHKEHCLSYIHDNRDEFIIKTFNPLNKKLHKPNLKFDVDTFDDYYKLAVKNINIDMSLEELINIFEE